jgi:phosphatidate cytidylyltransferase
MKELRTRAITAVFFAVIMVAGIYGHRVSFGLLFGVIMGLSVWEFLGLVMRGGDAENNTFRRIVGTFLGVFFYVSIALVGIVLRDDGLSPMWLVTSGAVCLWLCTQVLLGVELYLRHPQPFAQVGYILLSIGYIVLPYIMLAVIYNRGIGEGMAQPDVIMGVLLCVWINDSGAYFVGSKFGRHKLFARISPNKSWEGFVGGIVFALAGSFVLSVVFDTLSLPVWAGIALIAGVLGTMGDLVESMLKRSLNIKDSGNLLPGHGGILDRFDAFMFIIPFVGLFLMLTGYFQSS